MKFLFAAFIAVLLLSGVAHAASEHPPLSPHEKTALAFALHGKETGTITIACAGLYCKHLADDVAALFSAEKWKVNRINHGGMGIDGVVGLRANSCGLQEEKVRDTVEWATTRKVKTVDDGPCSGNDDRAIYLIIGTP